MMVIIYTVNARNHISVCAWSLSDQNYLYLSSISLLCALNSTDIFYFFRYHL